MGALLLLVTGCMLHAGNQARLSQAAQGCLRSHQPSHSAQRMVLQSPRSSGA